MHEIQRQERNKFLLMTYYRQYGGEIELVDSATYSGGIAQFSRPNFTEPKILIRPG